MSERNARSKRSTPAEKQGSRHKPGRSARQRVSPLALRAPAVQTKLEVNEPDDPLEREAGGVADAVMRSPAPAGPPPEAAPQNGVQRLPVATEETVQRALRPGDEEVQRALRPGEEELQRQSVPEAETIQRAGDNRPGVGPATASTIRNPGSGRPVPRSVRHRIEPHLGASLSGVRVHTGPAATAAAGSLQARAFTYRNHIFLNRAESSRDLSLMAHEATHVVQQGAAPIMRQPGVPEAASVQRQAAPDDVIQRLFDFSLDDLPGIDAADIARRVPGFTLFTVIIGYNPLTNANVDRNATNLLQGLMELVPFGADIFDALNERGIIRDAFAWVEAELDRLNLSRERIGRVLSAAWEEIDLLPPFSISGNLQIIVDHFGALYNDVVSFARSLVSHIVEMIKEAAISLAEEFLAENRAWDLIKKILGRDPLRDERVEATPVEILEDFLMLIGKEEELRQMRERGTLEETANWLATQITTFMSLLGELRELITAAWQAIQPENLANLAGSLRDLATRVGGFLQRVWDFATTVAAKVLELIKNALLSWLSEFAHELPGFHLLTVIIERNPFTGERVPRTAQNLIRGFITLLPGGNAIYEQLSQTGTIAQAAGRIEGAMAQLGISWEFIVGLFTGIWESLTIQDLVDPIAAFMRIRNQFGEPISRLFAFVNVVLREMLTIILEMMNFPTDLVTSIISNAMQAIEDIKNDPVGFLMNMLQALKQGFTNFFDNILTHLLGGLADWLFRGLRQAGIEPPDLTSLESILDFALEVMGISMERIWQKLAERIGQENVDRIRGAIDRLTGIWNFVRDVQERGVAAIWEYIESQITGLWDMILQKAQEWIMERVINRAIQWLLSLLDPTGIMPVINSFIAFFNAVQSAIEYLRDILGIVNDYVTTLAAVARGDIGPGAQKMEQGLANAIPIVIGFLARQFGLANIGETIQNIVTGLRALVDRALDWLLDRAVSMGQAVLRMLGFGGDEQQPADAQQQPPGDPGDRFLLTTFTENREEHSVYIDLTNSAAPVMVASDHPQPVPDLLNHLQSRLETIPDDGRRNRARELIGLARTAFSQIPVRQYRSVIVRSASGERTVAGRGVSLETATGQSAPLGRHLRDLFDIFCMGRELPAARSQRMNMYVEITVAQPAGSLPATGTVIPPAPREGAPFRSDEAGTVTGQQRSEGATHLMTQTWSMGEGERRADHTTHAERHFANWFEQQPWRERVTAIEVHNRPLSPCTHCADILRGLLARNSQIRTALFFWSVPYDLQPIATRPGDLQGMQNEGWIVHPGPQALSRLNGEQCPRS